MRLGTGLAAHRLRALALTAVLATCAIQAACAGVEVISGTGGAPGGSNGGSMVGTGGGTGTGGGSASSALLGRWTRVLLVIADNGDAHESRTTWEFRQDGSAIRTVTAWNLSQGVFDTLTSVAQWTASGSQLTITYIAPITGTVAFAYSINGDVLTVGPDQYARLR
jgi:hypothetical protein